MYQGSEIFKYLQSDQEIPKNLIVDFDSQIRKLSFDGKDFLLKSLSKKGQFYFLPSHTNKKYRKKLKIKVDKNQTLKLALGRTLERGQNNRFITFYELEGETSTEGGETSPVILKQFCQKIEKMSPRTENPKEKFEKKFNLESYKSRSPKLFRPKSSP